MLFTFYSSVITSQLEMCNCGLMGTTWGPENLQRTSPAPCCIPWDIVQQTKDYKYQSHMNEVEPRNYDQRKNEHFNSKIDRSILLLSPMDLSIKNNERCLAVIETKMLC